MSWFHSSSTDSNSANLHPVQLAFDQEALFGPLVPQDTEWLQAGGFVTETQVFYATTKDGGIIMCQVIHSSVGVWYPSIQFTFRYVNPKTNQHVWKSTAVTNFTTAPSSNLDKRSIKSDQFTITVDPSTPNKYTIIGKYDDEVQISLVYESLTPGWKVGAGPRGGMTYFGHSKESKSTAGPTPDHGGGADGYAVHRFWPRCAVSGIVRIGQEVLDVDGSRGTFIHAIQGMRPNVLAAKWNFANFQSSAEGGEGVALTMMEFETTPSYGSKKVNIGSVVVGDKLVAITAGGEGVVGKSVAEHVGPIKDVETGYHAPSSIKYQWEGVTLTEDGKPTDKKDLTTAILNLDLLTSNPGEPYQTRGLIEKVDVLGQIPYLVKKFVNYAAGTKPYIYTWLNPAKATISTPSKEAPIVVDGHVFSESTWIS
ncbi:oxidative stress survival, Svf1-like protein [Leucosporidium creatinivorum]|uniref:Oxidative stress survival, Svf1-like protein n=1 Tax=Leucosporidium creatinivorum TaxID=106004 RepID=A0A1Y2E2U5_9BASI|nr:oxidative stress survival, Svf1-like protein [Leucosporidium creatinivorum]